MDFDGNEYFDGGVFVSSQDSMKKSPRDSLSRLGTLLPEPGQLDSGTLSTRSRKTPYWDRGVPCKVRSPSRGGYRPVTLGSRGSWSTGLGFSPVYQRPAYQTVNERGLETNKNTLRIVSLLLVYWKLIRVVLNGR